jgi:hypothetical protein
MRCTVINAAELTPDLSSVWSAYQSASESAEQSRALQLAGLKTLRSEHTLIAPDPFLIRKP